MNLRTTPSVDADINRTEPSPIAAFAPPVWNENGSSFGPQLFRVHGHVVGPPMGVLLLLTLASLEPGLIALLGPE